MLNSWIIDSGASAPMSSRREWFRTYRALTPPRRVWLGDESFIEAVGIGSMALQVHDAAGKLIPALIRNVYHVPELHGNLLSVGRFTSEGGEVNFCGNTCTLNSRSGDFSIVAQRRPDGLYVLHLVVEPSSSALYASVREGPSSSDDDNDNIHALATIVPPSSISKAPLEIWHRRLGHVNTEKVIQMYQKNLVTGMEITGDLKVPTTTCTPCMQGKQTRSPIPSKSNTVSPRINHRIFSDNCGPMQTQSRLGHLYFNTHIDGHSHHLHVELMKRKSETEVHVQNYVTRSELETGESLLFYRSDGGGEYESTKLATFFKAKGIHHEKTNADTPQENGISERMNRTLVEMARSMLHGANLPFSYWGDAILYAAYIINRLPTRALPDGRTPHEVHTGNIPSISHLRIFGCKAHAHVPDEKRKKLDAKSLECVFLGFSGQRKAYKVLHRPSGRVFESRDVRFDEGEGSLPSHVKIDLSAPPEASQNTPLIPSTSDTPATVEEANEESEVNALLEEATGNTSEDDTAPPPPPVRKSRAARTPTAPVRRSTRIATKATGPTATAPSNEATGPPRWTEVPPDHTPVGDSDEHANRTTVSSDPQTFEEAVSGPDAREWMAACAEELKTFVEKELFDEVEKPRGRKVVGSKWVFRTKYGADGQIQKYKARLVAQGFTQVHGIDYTETFAPVAKFTSIRALLALAAKLDLEIHQMDVKSAFLNGDLEEEIYMSPPPGFPPASDGYVWKLKKSLYGLKQASREWYKKVRTEFESLGFTRSQADHSVFHKIVDGKLLIVAVYVDDMLILGKSTAHILALKGKLEETYEMTDLGEARWILNMEVLRDRGKHTLKLSQDKYIEEILERHGMADCRPVSTPMAQNQKLTKLTEAEIDPKDYQRALGSLMYAMLGTRPDIAYAVGVLSQHAATPGEEHWTALMRVYRYLRGTSDLTLTYHGDEGESKSFPDPICYVDADWAADINDRRSISGHVFLMSGGAVCWSSKKQKSTALSSTEAEYMAASNATKEAIWVRTLLSELSQLSSGPTTLFIDNQSAMALAKNAAFHDRSKHIAVRHHFIREKLEDGDIDVHYVPTGDQTADVLTKALGREKHEKFIRGFGMV